jgi:hypothetical protein
MAQIRAIKTECKKYLFLTDIVEVSELPFQPSADALVEKLRDSFVFYVRTIRGDYYSVSLKDEMIVAAMNTKAIVEQIPKERLYAHFLRHWIDSRDANI